MGAKKGIDGDVYVCVCVVCFVYRVIPARDPDKNPNLFAFDKNKNSRHYYHTLVVQVLFYAPFERTFKLLGIGVLCTNRIRRNPIWVQDDCITQKYYN